MPGYENTRQYYYSESHFLDDEVLTHVLARWLNIILGLRVELLDFAS